nr:MAG TPA: hypothetical protein [Caudoviricetes sp.]
MTVVCASASGQKFTRKVTTMPMKRLERRYECVNK